VGLPCQDCPFEKRCNKRGFLQDRPRPTGLREVVQEAGGLEQYLKYKVDDDDKSRRGSSATRRDWRDQTCRSSEGTRRRLKEKADGRRPRSGPVDQQQKVQKQKFGTLLKHKDKESRLINNKRNDESTPLSNRPIGSRKKAQTNIVINGEPSLD
jgi:hypothetical protein